MSELAALSGVPRRRLAAIEGGAARPTEDEIDAVAPHLGYRPLRVRNRLRAAASLPVVILPSEDRDEAWFGWTDLLFMHILESDSKFSAAIDAAFVRPTVSLSWQAYLDPSIPWTDLSATYQERLAVAIDQAMAAAADVQPTDPDRSYWRKWAEYYAGSRYLRASWLRRVRRSKSFSAFLDQYLADAEAGPLPFELVPYVERWRRHTAQLSPELIDGLRDVSSEYMQWLKAHPTELGKIRWNAFEKVAAEILASRGFEVDITARHHDVSADLIAVRRDALGIESRYLVECKAIAGRVGLSLVNEVLGAAVRNRPHHSLLVTTSSFFEDVVAQRKQLAELNLHLRDASNVLSWLDDYKPPGDGLWIDPDIKEL